MVETLPKPENVRLLPDGSAVEIIDQTLLPNELRYLRLNTAQECYDAIARLSVRGAPAIGIFAGFAFYVLAKGIVEASGEGVLSADTLAQIRAQADFLESSRPTAVNLKWALHRMMRLAESLEGQKSEAALECLRNEAQSIQDEDVRSCFTMAKLGLSLIKDGDGIITHCNAGPLATSCYGTSIGPVMLGRELGMQFSVFVDETRPLRQGARLTSYELDKAGIDTTLICDGMSSSVMRQSWVQACFVGCDRVAANGDTANKIGTSNLAIVAKRYGVPFYVMCPTSTLDYECESGKDIPIELRDGNEIKTMWYERPMAPEGVKCYNPSFDVTDADLITAIVTEKGICYPPFKESLAALR